MQVQRILHPSGDVLPILLDDDGLPLPAPNEWILGRRALAENTLDRELRELIPLFRWAQKRPIDLYERIESGRGFSEADVKGGLVEALRRDQRKGRVTKIAVSPDVFNSRIATVTTFLGWFTDNALNRLSANDTRYAQIREHHGRLTKWLSSSTVNPPGAGGRFKRKQLTPAQRAFLISRIHVSKGEAQGFGRSEAVRFRNYVAIMLMLLCGLRRGELLSLRVDDINIGSISSVNVIRRKSDPNDERRPRPHIKREERPLPLDNDVAFLVDVYITLREELMEHSACDHSYLIVSDEGAPLSMNRLNDIFVELRTKHQADLPTDFSPHTLRYAFSKDMDRALRAAGMTSERLGHALALLRGDSSLDSADPYIAQEIEEQANACLGEYQKTLLASARAFEDVPY